MTKKNTTAKEYRAMADKELSATVRQLKEEIFQLRLQQATGQLENNQRIKQARKDLARALTIQTERASAQA